GSFIAWHFVRTHWLAFTEPRLCNQPWSTEADCGRCDCNDPELIGDRRTEERRRRRKSSSRFSHSEGETIMAVKQIPDGYHTVTPFLNAKGTAQLLEFLKAALNAEEVMRMPGPGGVVMHAEVNIGNSRLMLSEATQTAPSSSSFYLYVTDVDALYR